MTSSRSLWHVWASGGRAHLGPLRGVVVRKMLRGGLGRYAYVQYDDDVGQCGRVIVYHHADLRG